MGKWNREWTRINANDKEVFSAQRIAEFGLRKWGAGGCDWKWVRLGHRSAGVSPA